MKRIFLIIFCIASSLISYLAIADFSVNLYVDSAPNVYGSSNWGPWWSETKTYVVGGSFTNMRKGTYPGTNYYDPYDMIVYSTGDLGKRIHWIYWIPGKTKSELDKLFQVKWVIDWEGTAYTYDWSIWDLIEDGPEKGWVQPSSWEDYSDGVNGVIGSFGFAWWAVDDLADPKTTDGNPYNETNQADIDELRKLVFKYQTYANGIVRYRQNEGSNWEYMNIKLTPVPEPGTLLLLGSGLIGLAGYGKIHFSRRKKS